MMMKIRTLIVDDMPLARERIRMLLSSDPEIEIIGERTDGDEAVEAVRNLKPELVFLDVQMPGLDGFGVVEKIGVEWMPVVVFVTAYDEFAIKAFEVSALDYLLKPFEEEQLIRAVKRAKSEIQKRQASDLNNHLQKLLAAVKPETKYLKRIVVKSAAQTTLVQTEDIDWIGAAGNYLELHVGKETYLVRERISRMEQNLDPEKFARIHRSTIVNLDRIKTLHPLFNGDHITALHDETKLNMSRAFYGKLLLRLKGK
jgi:two-component system LytT family response regulator